MGDQITNLEWEKLSPDNFETASLLRAVDAIDDLRGVFNDGDYSAPPQIRTDLLRLHEIAMAVINAGSRRRVPALFELASDLDEQISHLVNRLDEVQDTLTQLMGLYPESLYYDDIEGDEG
ncbi:transposase [Rahnella sp. ChDrAdgB13]|uniref:transposase n=1 Tax=Rahnella sp. ChDrAdgB13 TaxID=1850581 RepID=UPI001AD85ABC|nr:transposase [Rahnella sp. ChDrAdgB13]